jgi:hypothetical protein
VLKLLIREYFFTFSSLLYTWLSTEFVLKKDQWRLIWCYLAILILKITADHLQ